MREVLALLAGYQQVLGLVVTQLSNIWQYLSYQSAWV